MSYNDNSIQAFHTKSSAVTADVIVDKIGFLGSLWFCEYWEPTFPDVPLADNIFVRFLLSTRRCTGFHRNLSKQVSRILHRALPTRTLSGRRSCATLAVVSEG